MTKATPKLKEFEKKIIEYAGWQDLSDTGTLEDIKQAATKWGLCDGLDRLDTREDFEWVGAEVYAGLWDYLKETRGIPYIEKFHKNNIYDGDIYPAIVQEATQITAQHILDRLEEEEEDDS